MDIEIGCESNNPSRQTSRNFNFWMSFFCAAIFKVVQRRCLKEDSRAPQQNSHFLSWNNRASGSLVICSAYSPFDGVAQHQVEERNKEQRIWNKGPQTIFFVATEGSLKNRKQSQSLLIKRRVSRANRKPRVPADYHSTGIKKKIWFVGFECDWQKVCPITFIFVRTSPFQTSSTGSLLDGYTKWIPPRIWETFPHVCRVTAAAWIFSSGKLALWFLLGKKNKQTLCAVFQKARHSK